VAHADSQEPLGAHCTRVRHESDCVALGQLGGKRGYLGVRFRPTLAKHMNSIAGYLRSLHD
jgi:hypothetical protein